MVWACPSQDSLGVFFYLLLCIFYQKLKWSSPWRRRPSQFSKWVFCVKNSSINSHIPLLFLVVYSTFDGCLGGLHVPLFHFSPEPLSNWLLLTFEKCPSLKSLKMPWTRGRQAAQITLTVSRQQSRSSIGFRVNSPHCQFATQPSGRTFQVKSPLCSDQLATLWWWTRLSSKFKSKKFEKFFLTLLSLRVASHLLKRQASWPDVLQFDCGKLAVWRVGLLPSTAIGRSLWRQLVCIWLQARPLMINKVLVCSC